MKARLLFVFLIFFAQTLNAEVLVLVHGWMSNASTWYRNGIMPVLHQRGWQDAGETYVDRGHVILRPALNQSKGNPVYRVNLPAHAPMPIQEQHLAAQLRYAKQRHPGQSLAVVGHSAGGVVARLALVRNPGIKARILVTIASPHLGTPRAIQGLDVVNTNPFPGASIIKRILGGTDYNYLEASQALLMDVTPQNPGNLLGWLNRQRHPNMHYHSIIRARGYAVGDDIVPGMSQDMNAVQALRGKSVRHVTPTGHFLKPADGSLVADILSKRT